MRLALLCLLVPTIAGADNVMIGGATDDAFPEDSAPRRLSAGVQVIGVVPSFSDAMTGAPQSFGTPEQHKAMFEFDAPLAIRVLPWLRAVPLVGVADFTLAWNDTCQVLAPCMHTVDQYAIMLGAGVQAFYRRGGWEGYVDLTFRAPVPIGSSNSTFFSQSGSYDGSIDGGESVALGVGIARRADATRFFAGLGYMRTVVAFDASDLGLSESGGGLYFSGGISQW
ncbi:MAG TPA: hypothetical protein VGG28_11610 [Kofleriaceae bacterium]|jgi:hypothetical protein